MKMLMARRKPVQNFQHFEKKMFDEWRLKNGDTVRVGTDRASGFDLVHIRRWQGPTRQLSPTVKGIAIQIKDLPRLLKALRRIRTYAEKTGLLSIHRARN